MVGKKQKQVIELDGSDDVLKFHNNEIEINVLERILEDATCQRIDKKALVIVTYQRRGSKFDENPNWIEFRYNISLRKLFDIYKETTGEDYKSPTFEEIEHQARMEIRRR